MSNWMANDMAFPVVLETTRTPNDSEQLGLTKREYIAAHIMAAETSADTGERHLAKIAEHAVKAADYLLLALAQSR